MTGFLSTASPPRRPLSPSPFRQNILKQSHGGAGARGRAACSARHSCLPAHLPSAHCQRGAAGQRLRLQEATAQSPAFWAQLLTPPYLSWLFHTPQSARIILESEGSRGGAASLQSPAENCARTRPCVCLPAFSMAADGAAHVSHSAKQKKSLDSV